MRGTNTLYNEPLFTSYRYCRHSQLHKICLILKCLWFPWGQCRSIVVHCCLCHSDSASVLLNVPILCTSTYTCGAGSTVPHRGVRLKCYYAFFLVCCGCDTSYIVSVHIQCQASVYTLLLCRGHSWQVRLAKQETLTPPGHLVSPLVCRGP